VESRVDSRPSSEGRSSEHGRSSEPEGLAGEGIGFDELLVRLRAVVERLEQGSLSLEQSLAAYEEGVHLARRGHALLNAAETRIELLVQERENGFSTVPLDARPLEQSQKDEGDEGDDGGEDCDEDAG
jgi:exodeoxyribonuclease VII small subunit